MKIYYQGDGTNELLSIECFDALLDPSLTDEYFFFKKIGLEIGSYSVKIVVKCGNRVVKQFENELKLRVRTMMIPIFAFLNISV